MPDRTSEIEKNEDGGRRRPPAPGPVCRDNALRRHHPGGPVHVHPDEVPVTNPWRASVNAHADARRLARRLAALGRKELPEVYAARAAEISGNLEKVKIIRNN